MNDNENKTTLSAEKNNYKTTITDGDLISRNNAIELVNYALAENKDVLEVLGNMPSAEKIGFRLNEILTKDNSFRYELSITEKTE